MSILETAIFRRISQFLRRKGDELSSGNRNNLNFVHTLYGSDAKQHPLLMQNPLRIGRISSCFTTQYCYSWTNSFDVSLKAVLKGLTIVLLIYE